jgi:hypothetical protein
MKPLNETQARNCEEALHPTCKCRCNGALHGVKRGGKNPPREWYEQLPLEDPHFVPKKKKRKKQISLEQLSLFEETP